MKPTTSQDNQSHTAFMSHVSDTYSTRFGGESSLGNMEDWAKNVKTNPVIIKFTIKSIFDLLTQAKGRFPNEANMTEKSKMIERALDNYVKASGYCYGNSCSGHGSCNDTGNFQLGQCQCQNGWSGDDCSKRVTEKPKPLVPSGTLCGHSGGVVCEDASSSRSCPWGWHGTGWSHCMKTNSDTQRSPTGTICGYVTGSLVVLCDGRHPYTEPCPLGYQNYNEPTIRFCYKMDSSREDLPGTMCGIHVETYTEWKLESSYWSTITDLPCDGYYPGRGSCPPNYRVRTGRRVERVDCGVFGLGTCDKLYDYAFCSKN